MLSFKPFLQREEPARNNLQSAHQRMIVMLLEGLVLHAVRGSPADYESFKSDLSAIQVDIAADRLDSEELLIATGSAVKSLQEYNRRTTAVIQAQSQELQKITAMLTQTIVNLSGEGSLNVARLQAIERQLETTVAIDDVRQLKEKLSDCLGSIREERLRQKSATEKTIEQLGENLAAAQKPVDLPELDPTTFFGTRGSAEGAITNVVDGAVPYHGAIFVIDHLHSLNTRFGRAVGDQIIQRFVHHMKEHLRSQDACFRWSGPSFLALLAREDPAEKIRRELSTMTSARLELTVEVRGRTVLLPLHFSWTLIPVPPCGKAGAIIDSLDAFVASRAKG